MNNVKILFLVGLLGIVLIGFGVFSALQGSVLLRDGVTVRGTVVDVKESVRTDRNGHTERRYVSTISFAPVGGATTTFSSAGNYQRGSQLDVIYLPSDPSTAHVKSFNAVWGTTIALCGFGTLLAGIGFIGALVSAKRQQTIAELIQHGAVVRGSVIGIKTSENMGHRNRNRTVVYQVVVRANEEVHGLPRQLVSSWMRTEPSDSIIGTEVDVFYDPAKPSKYHVQLNNMD